MRDIRVTAVPLTTDDPIEYAVECTECGPIQLTDGDEVHQVCQAHMRTHGAVDIHTEEH